MGITSPRFIVLLIAASFACMAATPSPQGVPRFIEVNEHIFRGGQPAETGIESLAALGVHAVIDLRAAGSRSVREKKLVEAAGMKYYSVPFAASRAPSDQQVTAVLNLMSDSTNWPVFIHCRLGKDRTGTVIACYRIVHDKWPNARALTEAVDNGLNFTEHGMKTYIKNFQAPASLAKEQDATLPVHP